MAKDCYVEQLVGVVDNDSLEKLGFAKVRVGAVPSGNTYNFETNSGKTVTLRLYDDQGVLQRTIITANPYFAISTAMNGEFENWYNLKNISFGTNSTWNTKLLRYSTGASVTEVRATGTKVTGVITDLANFTACTFMAINQSKITGDLSELAKAQVAKGRTSGTMRVEM